jgi:hypothetical protein
VSAVSVTVWSDLLFWVLILVGYLVLLPLMAFRLISFKAFVRSLTILEVGFAVCDVVTGRNAVVIVDLIFAGVFGYLWWRHRHDDDDRPRRRRRRLARRLKARLPRLARSPRPVWNAA